MCHTELNGSWIIGGDKDVLTPYSSPVLAILMKGDPSKLIPELREAIRINPKLAAIQVGFHLAVALARTGDASGAISTIRKAIEQGPHVRFDILQLMWPIALMDQKKELIAILRQLREAAKNEKPVFDWIERAVLLTERLVAIGSRLPKIFHGAVRVSEYPFICHLRRLFSLEAELWSIAFDVEPALIERHPTWYLDRAPVPRR